MRRVPQMIFPVMWVEESKLSRFRINSYFQRLLSRTSGTDSSQEEEATQPLDASIEEDNQIF